MHSDQWNRHERLLLDYERAWSVDRPGIADFLSQAQASGGPELNVGYLALELAKIDLERQLKRGVLDKRCESYLQELPQLQQEEGAVLELLSHEVAVRNELGMSVDDHELAERFPDQADALMTIARSGSGRGASGSQWITVPQPGDHLKQYRLEEVVGQGSFAVVFRAHDTTLNRAVAIKLLRPGSATDDAQRRMRREAMATASLKHQHIVPIIEIGSHEGREFIVAQFIDGPTLEEYLARRDVSLDESARIAEALSDALAEAHANGIVHRDMKPANVLMDAEQPKITDFGLAHLGEASIHLTNEGDVLGTPAYMPPEQAAGNAWQADPRSDIYSVGVILYRMTTGVLPFEGSAASVLQQVLHKDPPPPRKLKPAFPRDLQTIILKCLEKDPIDRYQTATQFTDDLRAYRSGHSIAAKPSGPASRVWKWSRRRPALAIATAVALLLLSLAIGIGSQYWRTRALLAESSASAGTLAMQRGQAVQALGFFDQAMAEGHRQPEALQLRKVDALALLGRFDEAREEVEQLQGNESLSAKLRGELQLWQAEMALAHQDPNATELLQAALDAELGPADAAYAAAMLSPRTPDAVELLQEAVTHDRAHYRARRLLSLLLLSLARFDEAGESIRMGISAFPSDDDFRLMNAMWHATQSGGKACTLELDKVELTPAQREDWEHFCDTLHTLRHTRLSMDPYAIHWTELCEDFEQRYRPLMAERHWTAPPRIMGGFLPLITAIKQVDRGPYVSGQPLTDAQSSSLNTLADVLRERVEVHPEGSLFLMLGNTEALLNYLHQNREDDWGHHDLEEAQEAFLSSRDYPSWVAGKMQHMYDGLLGTSLVLWLGGRDPDQSRALFVDAAENIDPSFVATRAEMRALALGSLRAEEGELKVKWARHFLEQAPDDAEAKWIAAIVFRDEGLLSESLRLSQELLQLESDENDYPGLHTSIVERLADELESARQSAPRTSAPAPVAEAESP